MLYRCVVFLRSFPNALVEAPKSASWLNCPKRCQSWATFASSKPLPCRLWNVWPSSSSASSSERNRFQKWRDPKNIQQIMPCQCVFSIINHPFVGYPHLWNPPLYIDHCWPLRSVDMCNIVQSHMCISCRREIWLSVPCRFKSIKNLNEISWYVFLIHTSNIILKKNKVIYPVSLYFGPLEPW